MGVWILPFPLILGGTFEDLARERSPQSIALGMLVVPVKVAGGLLALALVQPWGTHVGRRLILVSAAVGSVVLVVYGGVLVLVGGLVLADLITPPAPVDEHALRWHVFVWDLWFLVWGMSFRARGLTVPRQRQVSVRRGRALERHREHSPNHGVLFPDEFSYFRRDAVEVCDCRSRTGASSSPGWWARWSSRPVHAHRRREPVPLRGGGRRAPSRRASVGGPSRSNLK